MHTAATERGPPGPVSWGYDRPSLGYPATARGKCVCTRPRRSAALQDLFHRDTIGQASDIRCPPAGSAYAHGRDGARPSRTCFIGIRSAKPRISGTTRGKCVCTRPRRSAALQNLFHRDTIGQASDIRRPPVGSAYAHGRDGARPSRTCFIGIRSAKPRISGDHPWDVRMDTAATERGPPASYTERGSLGGRRSVGAVQRALEASFVPDRPSVAGDLGHSTPFAPQARLV